MSSYLRDFADGDLTRVVVAKYQEVGASRKDEWIYFGKSSSTNKVGGSLAAIGFLRRTRKCLVIALDFCFVFFSSLGGPGWFNSWLCLALVFAMTYDFCLKHHSQLYMLRFVDRSGCNGAST